MYDLILNTAERDERIRAVMLNGSRANPNAPKDILQDYDIVYVVTDVALFRQDPSWIHRFGDLMILQEPDVMGDGVKSGKGDYAYLMQFTDGNRIDLTLFPVVGMKDYPADSLSRVLLDKDGLFQSIGPAHEGDYLPKPPTARAFFECCNEFWWIAPYAAKGLRRGEILHAKAMMEDYGRTQLMKVLTWHIGLKTGFAVNPGKQGKYFKRFLEPEIWEALLQTYSDADYGNTWAALFGMADLFRRMAKPLADHYGFDYPADDDRLVTGYLRRIKGMAQIKTLPGGSGKTLIQTEIVKGV